MTTKELIEKAVENLNRVKQLNLENIDIIEHLGSYEVEVLDNESGEPFNAVVNKDLLAQQLLPDDPTNLAPEKIIMLRIAKVIFEAYKKFKNNIVNDNLTLNNNQTISSLKIGQATYDIGVNGRSLTATFNDVDELKDKLKDLEQKNQELEKDKQNLEAMVKIMWDKMTEKGMFQ